LEDQNEPIKLVATWLKDIIKKFEGQSERANGRDKKVTHRDP